MRAGKLYFIIKGGQGSGNFGHKGRVGEVGGSASSTPECSVDIKTQKEAEAYWKEKFVTGSPHKIEGHYGTRKFTIYVNFVRNHAYTENVAEKHGVMRDRDREFNLQRAQAMDAIWEVLKNPSAITWSQSNPLNKQFDKQLQAENERFGRVILSPTPTPKELATGIVTHYDFVSWHEPNSQQYQWALNIARSKHVSPIRMKKALPFNRAFMLPRTTIIPPSDEALPTHEGVTFNCASSFKGSHSPESKRSDRFHENDATINENSWFGKALGADERWITVHPNGVDAKGVPVLIREHKDGTATVIGGAGGKLNHLKLRGIKPASDYKETLRQKEKERREARKQQIAADKASGVHAQKEVARKKLKEQVKNERAEFVRTVAQLAGWTPEEVTFDEEKYASLSPEAQKKAREDHEKALFRKAKETVDINRKRLIEDADARAQAGLGEVPLQSDSDEALSVQDIAPLPEINAAKLGFNPEYRERSDLTDEQAKEEAAEFVPNKKNSEEEEAKRAAKKELHEKINQEIDEFTEKNPDSKPPDPRVLDDAKKAAELLKAHKRLKMMEANARAARKELDSAQTVESKGLARFWELMP